MKIKGKQLEDTLRTESAPFDIIYADRTVGDLNGSVRFTALNNSGGTIGAYKVVYITGSSGNLPTIGLADADAGSMPAFGLTTSSSDNGNEVDIVTFGNLKGVDTSLLSVGDVLYVSTTAGEYTVTPPTGNSTKLQNIGMVVKSDSNGIIKVGGAGRSNATPNLDEGKFFLGNASNQSVQSGYKLPTTVGTNGQVLASNGTDVTFQDASSGDSSYTISSVGSSNFTAVDNTFYYVDTSSGTTTSVTLPSRENDYNVNYRFKFFNHGDGVLRIMELSNPERLDPEEDGTIGASSGSSYKFFNSRCIVEVFSIPGTYNWEWVVTSQLELGKETLSADGEVLRYNASTDQMVALPYTFPTTVGTSGQVLTSNGTDVTFQNVSGDPTLLTADVAVGDFTPTHWITDPKNTTDITINLPTTRYEKADAFALDGDTFIIENAGRGNVILRIADAWHYVSPVYYQTFIRHSGDFDDQGVGAGEPQTYNIPALTNVKVHIKKEWEVGVDNSNKDRVVYHVVVGGL